MKIEIKQLNKQNVAEIVSDKILINNTQEALDIMVNAAYQGATKMIIHEKNINPHFFDLKTGIAGDILQKFSTYSMQLAIVGDFSKFSSKSLKDFIFESNKTGRINFVNSIEEAISSLIK